MKIHTQNYNNVSVVELQGDLDSDFVQALQKTVTEVIGKNRAGIVLDLSAVGFIDGQGLELLLWIKDYCNDNKVQLRLAGLDENCTQILKVTRLENEFNHYAELTEAVKSFA